MRGRIVVVALLALVMTTPARGDFFTSDRFTAYGDFRFRAEHDWDSRTSAGIEREDRARLRVRLRAGFRFEATEHWMLEARLRSGAEGSQQSPHITLIDFDDNDTGDSSFEFDRWYLRGKVGGFEAFAGRNGLPFWTQDELLFDDDVTMPGVAAAWSTKLGPGEFSMSGGYFTPPVGMRLYTGNLSAAQVSWRPAAGAVAWTLALGGYWFDASPADPDNSGLLQANGSRDYRIVSASVQARWKVAGRTLKVGADGMHNAQDYDPTDPDPVTAANHDQTDGYVLLATYGGLDARGDWLVGWYHARIETFAVNNSYSQDDWVRWGNATQTRGSDMKGNELRFGWALDERMNLLARLYLVDAITSIEDGNRFRIDFNFKF